MEMKYRQVEYDIYTPSASKRRNRDQVTFVHRLLLLLADQPIFIMLTKRKNEHDKWKYSLFVFFYFDSLIYF